MDSPFADLVVARDADTSTDEAVALQHLHHPTELLTGGEREGVYKEKAGEKKKGGRDRGLH